MKKAMISVKNLRKVYKIGNEKVVALDNINVTLGEGQVCCILGTSGSGKSTLLNMLAGLEKPTHGQVLVGKYDIAKMDETALAKFRQRYVGFVFQSYNLMASLTALENVSMPLMFKGVRKGVRDKEARKMLQNVGLGSRWKHSPSQMSGGQQQRVGIARAFVSKPRIVFADEPTGNLDTKTTIEVMRLMVQMSHDNNQTLIIVTHDPEIAEYADRVIHLIDGNIVSDITKTEEEMAAATKALNEREITPDGAPIAALTTEEAPAEPKQPAETQTELPKEAAEAEATPKKEKLAIEGDKQ